MVPRLLQRVTAGVGRFFDVHVFMHVAMLLRRKPEWRDILKGILFKKGSIVKHADDAEEAAE